MARIMVQMKSAMAFTLRRGSGEPKPTGMLTRRVSNMGTKPPAHCTTKIMEETVVRYSVVAVALVSVCIRAPGCLALSRTRAMSANPSMHRYTYTSALTTRTGSWIAHAETCTTSHVSPPYPKYAWHMQKDVFSYGAGKLRPHTMFSSPGKEQSPSRRHVTFAPSAGAFARHAGGMCSMARQVSSACPRARSSRPPSHYVQCFEVMV